MSGMNWLALLLGFLIGLGIYAAVIALLRRRK